MNALDMYRSSHGKIELSQILTYGSQLHPYGLPAAYLEKDMWVNEVLNLLFEKNMFNGQSVAFKGGTALSKCWKAIDRFSEDIDLSVHWADLAGVDDEEKAWMDSTKSRSQKDKFRRQQSEKLEEWSSNLVTDINKALSEYEIEGLKATLKDGSRGEKINIEYPKTIDSPAPYHLDHILLEFGGRNRGEPTTKSRINSYMSDIEPFYAVAFPSAMVDVFDISYIIWEKLTALHQLSSMVRQPDSSRISRHWYDVHSILNRNIVNPLEHINAMNDVIEMKQNRWGEKGVDYEAIACGGAKLIPDDERLEAIFQDYQDSVSGRMFFANIKPDNFSVIIETIKNFQNQINTNSPSIKKEDSGAVLRPKPSPL